MNKALLLFAAALAAAPLYANAADDSEPVKPKVVLTGIPWSVQGTSANGRYICGTKQQSMAYCYDTWNEKLYYKYTGETENKEIAAFDVTDDGVAVGLNDDGQLVLWNVAKDEWKLVETTDGKSGVGNAKGITGDGKYLVGYTPKDKTDPNKPYNINPTVWELQADGKYKEIVLPTPDKDLLGGTPQWVSPRYISQDGKRVIGPMPNETGVYIIPVIYTKADDGTWTYDQSLKDITYSDKFAEIYNEKPNEDDIITATPGSSDYFTQINEYLAQLQAWEDKLDSAGYTGHQFSATPIMSDNGRYLAGDATYGDWYGPAVYNIDTKEYTELTALTEGYYVAGVTNDGDVLMYAADATMTYLVPHTDYTKKISLTDMLNEYGIDLYSIIPSNTEYVDNGFISGDGQTITARAKYKETVDGEETYLQQMFCICLKPVVSAIERVLNTPTSDGISVKNGVVNLTGVAKNITVYSASGRLVASVSNADVLDASNVRPGVYLVKANVGGKTLTTKFIKD